VLRAGQQDVPPSRHAQAMAKRLLEHGKSYFTFVTTPGVQPTNNLAEQAIRFVVIDRHITQGTRSEAGRRWSERIWSVVASCTQQGRSVFAYLEAAVGAYFGGAAAPSLLPEG
jgi:transposase